MLEAPFTHIEPLVLSGNQPGIVEADSRLRLPASELFRGSTGSRQIVPGQAYLDQRFARGHIVRRAADGFLEEPHRIRRALCSSEKLGQVDPDCDIVWR